MPGLEIEPFSDAHLDDAAGLLAGRHRRHREAEPLLTEPPDLRAEIEALWGADGESSTHSGLARVQGASLLGFAATRPDVRGSGAGIALTQASFAWARERGYETMVTDWRVTNLLSSRFWPKRGFRTTFTRLYRSIP
jgi:GNAT superfamily N-acetyltransferase